MAAALLAGLALFAQNSLDGTWLYRDTESENLRESEFQGDIVTEMTMRLRIAADAYTMSLGANMSMDYKGKDKNGKVVDAVFKVMVNGSNTGTLTRSADLLTLTPPKGSKPQVEVDADAQGIPGGSLMKSMISGPMKKEVGARLKETLRFRILSATETELTLEEILTDKEIKKGEKPERMVLVRQ